MTQRALAAFDARPTQSLDAHCRGVAAAAAALSTDRGDTPFGEVWSTVARAVAWSHDFGKLTPWFQEYVATGDRTAAPSPKHTYHGEVSALITLPILNALGCSDATAAAGFIAVAKHHSVLPNIQPALTEYTRSDEYIQQRLDRCDDQLQAIDDQAADAADEIITTTTEGALSWDDIRGLSADDYQRAISDLIGTVGNDDFYAYSLNLWSTLVAADKSDASRLTTADNVTELTTTVRPDPSLLTQRVDRLSSTRLPNGEPARWYRRHPDAELPDASATIRQRVAAIQTAANGRATSTIEANPQTNVFEITLPTGFGKTYTGLRAALTRAANRDSRVIYSLPYTSIIDQVDSEIQSIFGLKPHSKPYTKHHHLADTRTADSDLHTEGYSTGRETLHAEAWRSGLVLTTFTQLFETLAGPGNVQSIKLPALHDSVIIIDEPQAAPHEWWGLIGHLISTCVELYDATVILMTATQPRFVDQLDETPTPTPLVGLGEACRSVLADNPRVTFDLHESMQAYFEREGGPLPLATAAEELVGETTGSSNTLSIVNTVDCAVTMSAAASSADSVALGDQLLSYHRNRDPDAQSADDYLQYLADRSDGAELLTATLTTRLRPVDRQLLIDAIGLITDPDTTTPFDGTPTVTISTQLIEAGVDISFDRLYRDFAPLPAIVQAAGRCNRSFGGPTRPVTIWRLDSPPQQEYIPSSLIYGDASLLRPTQIVLNELVTNRGTTLPESAVISDGIERYYDQLHGQLQTGDRTDELVTAYNNGEGNKLRTASLIDEEYTTIDVLVLITDSERELYKNYQQAKDENHWQEASSMFQQLQSCLVSVPVSDTELSADLRIADIDEDDDKYAINTGKGIALDDAVLDTEL
ncbi:CRISPR-associated endonuclease Cas3'' [Halonotius pteroides]|uniref:CRISPR-associated endonuclease Cas3 n=1 Tax=Halonotius pteroides TaxID=268735 RepID=A0A3A6PXJ6_9EURY|nr:CRISPR-associated endonuclease Cas3'' [Halonotius pteroides]RJX47995.1 CRISPR-associated endonuclease Cas3'' [Halonotius pteroides]